MQEIEITKDSCGRMNFHPEFHENRYKPYKEDDLEYLCKNWGIDTSRTMSYALSRTEGALFSAVRRLRRNGKFEYYKNLNKHW